MNHNSIRWIPLVALAALLGGCIVETGEPAPEEEPGVAVDELGSENGGGLVVGGVVLAEEAESNGPDDDDEPGDHPEVQTKSYTDTWDPTPDPWDTGGQSQGGGAEDSDW